MKVLQICFRPQIPANDGGAIAMYNLSNGFTNNSSVELSMFVFNTPKHQVKKEDLQKEFKTDKITHVFLDTSIHILDALKYLFSSKSYNVERFNNESVKQELKKLLLDKKFDLVHFEGLYASPLIETVKTYAPEAKLVFRSHNIEYLIWERRAAQAKNILQKWYLNDLAQKLKTYEESVIPKFDAIIPITKVDQEYFEKNGAKAIFTSSTGLDIANYTPCEEIKKNAVFHLGSMDWSPNQEAMSWFLANVWDAVVTQIPEAVFYIAGKNMPEYFNKFQSNNVKIVGEVEDAYEFMRNHGIMVVPLLSGSGMRIKIIEGMACACPILATSIGAEGIKYEHSENIIISDSANDFSSNLINLLKDTDMSISLGINARKNIKENYSNQAITDQLIHFYSSLFD